MQNSDQLIHTKLRLPLTRPGLISRPRLQEEISRGLCGPLTLITAPAGFGKTTLAAASVAGCGMPVAWLSLDKNDNRTGRFLNYLIAALQGAESTIGEEAAQLLASSPEPPTEAVLTSLLNDVDARGRDLTLVLDDYHFINSQAVHEVLEFLLEHCPQVLHLLIASRSDPPLPVARLRGRAQMVELRAADLRFTSEEAAEFLNSVMGLHLDAGSVAILEERTEGWIAGLQMAALSMRDREDVRGFIEAFSGTHRYILDYLLEEILIVQQPEVQQFLLCTSILERLSGPLCDFLLADPEVREVLIHNDATGSSWGGSTSQSMLDALERSNLFLVPLDDERTWYRYHHLFADLLRARLDQLYPGLSRRLHIAAAGWLERADMTVEAVNHSLSAGEFDRAARLVEENTTRLLAQGELNALTAWIETLPVELRLRRPWLCVHQSYALLFAGRSAEVGPLLDQAEAHATDAAQDRALHGAVTTVRAFSAAIMMQEDKALSQAQEARKLLGPDDLFDQSLIAWARGYALHNQGHLSEARAAFEEQIRLSKEMQNSATLMIGVTALARVLADQGEFCEARALLEDVLVDARQKHVRNRGYVARVESHLAALLCEQNELEAAHHLLSDALSCAPFWLNPNHLVSIHAFLTRVLLAKGDYQGARTAIGEVDHIRRTTPLSKWLRRALEVDIVRAWLALRSVAPDIAPDDPLAEQSRIILASWRSEPAGPAESVETPMSQCDELPLLTLARVSLASGRTDEALALLEPVTRRARIAGHTDTAVQCLVLTAMAFQGRHVGRLASALAALDEALSLAEPGGYVRVFLNEGQAMQALLEQWMAKADAGALRDYGARLLTEFAAEREATAARGEKASPMIYLVEPLTSRELEVLQLLCAGDSNQMIADKLVITVSTVKKHIGNILGKLGVTSRAQAMVKARQYGLLPKDD